MIDPVNTSFTTDGENIADMNRPKGNSCPFCGQVPQWDGCGCDRRYESEVDK